MSNFPLDFWLAVGAFAIFTVPQVLAYFLSGLSGSASQPKFVSQVADLGVWFVIKSYSAAAGAFLGAGITYITRENYIILPLVPLFMLAAAFMLAWIYVVAGQVVNFVYGRKMFSPFRRVHEFFTRYSAPAARSSALTTVLDQAGLGDAGTSSQTAPSSQSSGTKIEPALRKLFDRMREHLGNENEPRN
jgi:hypothetical protein